MSRHISGQSHSQPVQSRLQSISGHGEDEPEPAKPEAAELRAGDNVEPVFSKQSLEERHLAVLGRSRQITTEICPEEQTGLEESLV